MKKGEFVYESGILDIFCYNVSRETFLVQSGFFTDSLAIFKTLLVLKMALEKPANKPVFPINLR